MSTRSAEILLHFKQPCNMESNKIFIQDVVAKMEGGVENELPANTTVRFEMGGMSFEVSIYEFGGEATLKIRKTCFQSLARDAVKIAPQHQNEIILF